MPQRLARRPPTPLLHQRARSSPVTSCPSERRPWSRHSPAREQAGTGTPGCADRPAALPDGGQPARRARANPRRRTRPAGRGLSLDDLERRSLSRYTSAAGSEQRRAATAPGPRDRRPGGGSPSTTSATVAEGPLRRLGVDVRFGEVDASGRLPRRHQLAPKSGFDRVAISRMIVACVCRSMSRYSQSFSCSQCGTEREQAIQVLFAQSPDDHLRAVRGTHLLAHDAPIALGTPASRTAVTRSATSAGSPLPSTSNTAPVSR